MRIALLIERFGPLRGGVENVAWTVAHELARSGDEVHVVAREAEPSEAVELHRVDVSAAWQPLRVRRYARETARIAPRGAFDVVYSLARTAEQDVYRAGAGSHLSYMERRYGRRWLALQQLSPRHATLLALERGVFADPSQLVVCNSDMVRRELREHYAIDPKRLAVIRNGVDLERFALDPTRRSAERGRLRDATGADASAPVWLFAGSGFERKGLDTTIAAFASARSDDAELWVAGADATNTWQRLAADRGVAERVRFLGHRSDMPAVYAAADALVLPTRYDACANACLEAAAAGLPVVTTVANGAAEVLEGAGVTVRDPEDVAAVAGALDALADADTRSRLGDAARAAAAKLSWADHTTQLRALFAGLQR